MQRVNCEEPVKYSCFHRPGAGMIFAVVNRIESVEVPLAMSVPFTVIPKPSSNCTTTPGLIVNVCPPGTVTFPVTWYGLPAVVHVPETFPETSVCENTLQQVNNKHQRRLKHNRRAKFFIINSLKNRINLRYEHWEILISFLAIHKSGTFLYKVIHSMSECM
jgi:hypothetical protein